jgi:transposase
MAQGKLRKKIPALREALEGRFDHLHALLIGAILALLDFLDEQIERLTDAIGEQLGPFGTAAVEVLRTMDGIETRTAQAIIGEIGTDMSVFATARHLCSWAGRCPGNDQSAGKRRSGRTRKGSRWLHDALKDAAMAAIRTRDSYFQAQYQRLRPRLGPQPRARCGHALDADRDLAHALYQRDLPRPRR